MKQRDKLIVWPMHYDNFDVNEMYTVKNVRKIAF